MKNWKQKEFGQFVNLRKDKYQPTLGQRIPCVELECITKNSGEITHTISSETLSSIKNHFSKGDVLFGKLRPYLRKYALPQHDGVCSTEIWVLHPKEGFCSPEFLFLLIQSNKFIYTANLSCGSRMPRADWDLVSSTPFLLPELQEQQKIVEVLETWDKAIQLTRKLIEQKELQKKGLLQQLVYKQPKTVSYFLRQLFTLGRGRVISKEEIALHPGAYPVYSSQTADNGVLGFINTFDFDGEYITWTTDGANAGKVFYRTGKFNCTNVCGTAQLKQKNQHNLYYIMSYLNNVTKKYVSYVGNPKLMNGVFANILIALPSKELQDKAAALLTTLDKDIDVLRQKLAKLEEQKKGLMQVLLTGKVRLKI